MNRDLPHRPHRDLRSILRKTIVTAAIAALLLGVGQASQADELDDRSNELTKQLEEQTAAVEGASKELSDAVSALNAAQGELDVAKDELAKAEAATAEAKALDEKRAAELKEAEQKLAQAKAAVIAAQLAYDEVDQRASEEIALVTQQNGPLVDLALLLTDIEAGSLNQRAQLATTLFDGTASELDELEERRIALEAAEQKADEAEKAAEEARAAAAEQLKTTEAAEAVAAQAKLDTEAKVTQRDNALAAAEKELEQEETRQNQLEAEKAEVDKRIKERIAKAEAEAAAAKKAAAEKAKSSSSSSSSSGSSSSSSGSSGSSSSSSSSGGFSRPVSGRITSPYGMRTHPITGVYKLHDGTDFSAGCGTPIKAPYAGTVSERYYNSAYGNRLMIDHGKVNGQYVTTGYNHATRYIVSVGQRVSKGQVIGYAGTTGYSTGCHLHLMVWQNGSLVNPMAKWF